MIWPKKPLNLPSGRADQHSSLGLKVAQFVPMELVALDGPTEMQVAMQ